MNREEYNEEDFLRQYIFNYYPHLFTKVEELSFKRILANEKAIHSSPKMANILKKSWGSENNPKVDDALREGIEKFKQAVFARLMQEHKDEIFINRCPECNKIVRTPKAKQRPWCFHDWH